MSASGRGPATENHAPMGGAEEALGLMERALRLIDEIDGPQDVGANLDLAIHRLRDWLEQRQFK